MSLLDMLNNYTLPKRGAARIELARLPGGGSTATSPPDMNLVAACIRAADPSHPQDPAIIFECSSSLLDRLGDILSQSLKPEAPLPPDFYAAVRANEFDIEFNDSLSEVDHYPLFETVYRLGLLRLMLDPSIFVGQKLPTRAEWVRETLGTIGKGDFEITKLADFGDWLRAGVVAENKREVILVLTNLVAFLRAVTEPGGARLSLGDDGLPFLSSASGRLDNQHTVYQVCQVVLELDASAAHTNVLCSWDYFLPFHRVDAAKIHVSKIVET